MHRTKRILTQQIIAKKGLIKGRAKKNSRDWCHPREASPDNPDHLRFFAHTWTIYDLLKSFEEADIRIQEEFQDLGMHQIIAEEPLYQILSPEDRMQKLSEELADESSETAMANLFVMTSSQNQPKNCNEQAASSSNTKIAKKRQKSERLAPKLSAGGHEMTVSAYVTIFKQRGDKRMSGLRNIFRFRQADDDPEPERNTEIIVKGGDLFLTKRNHLVEILQVRGPRKKFLIESELLATTFYIGISYRRQENGNIYYAVPEYTARCYSNLRKSFRRKVIAENRWADENDPDLHYCRLAQTDIDSIGEEDETQEELHGDTKYCYCRANAEKDHLIGCDNENCRITWYHQSCLGFESEEEIPKGEYVCPRCKGEDHWCLCGKEEDFDKMIGCNCAESCLNEWYHLQCINLFSTPSGDWFCDDCIESGKAAEEEGSQCCTCLRTSNFDELIKCSSLRCPTKFYHKCCIDIEREDVADWLCQLCAA
eukprot:Seg1261.10 transcript_id=Seg1261.10/GoldUCD/mRNA.D3Y31 product="Chromatin modification-related protein png2" protein_id=Seg1261.10/GoldUCD/D3Y31